MATWPASLPQKLEQQGFSMGYPTGAIRTDVSAGRPFQRQRYTAAIEPFTGVLWLDQTQYDTLMTFWRDTLAHGTLEFTWTHPVTGASATVQFNATTPPRITSTRGELFEVSIQAEVLP